MGNTTPTRQRRSKAEDPMLGVLVADRYRLLRVIARGAMGTVYLAEQRPLNRKVAVKILDVAKDVDDPESFYSRFEREATVLARLQHPNTVRVYDFGQWGGVTYLVMEYIDGFSLRRLQAGGPMPPSRVIKIALQICAALQEAHAIGLMHRDLKPANVLVTRHAGALDVVKVVDFGLAKGFYGVEQDLTQVGQVLGTPMYMSPEQIRDDPCDPRSDIYSLGVLLYRCVTGDTPFPKGTTTAMLMANLYDPPRRFREVAPRLDVPPAVEWVVMRCLEKRPQDRFANVMELQKALQACLIAEEDPSLRMMALQVEDGHTILPDDVTEASHSSLRLQHVPLQRKKRAAAEAEGAPPPEPSDASASSSVPSQPADLRPILGSVPDWMLAVGFGMILVTGLLAGVFAERAMRSVTPAAEAEAAVQSGAPGAEADAPTPASDDAAATPAGD